MNRSYQLSITLTLLFTLGYLLYPAPNLQVSQEQPPIEKSVVTANNKADTELNDNELIHEFEKFALHLQEKESSEQTPDTPINIFSKIETQSLSNKEGVSPLFAIKLNKKILENLDEGSQISLPNFGSISYHAHIKVRKRHLDGTLSLIAKLDDEYEKYSVIITLGDKKSFATFHTPEGSFELEAEKELGYLYAVDEIDTQWIDYNQDDTLPLSHS